jgi:hypothetical protein
VYVLLACTSGFETTAHTICWTLFLLATHPEAEQRLCEELDALGLLASPERPQPGALQWEHLSQLKYLSAVINESMRMYPVTSSGVIRVTHAPINLGGHHLPPGQPILVPMWAVHRSAHVGSAVCRGEGGTVCGAGSNKPVTTADSSVCGSPAAATPPAPTPKPCVYRSPRLWPAPDEFRPERFLAAGTPAPSDYVDVAADIAAWRDQEGQQQPAAGSGKEGGAGSGNKGGADGGSSRAALDVKVGQGLL